jgi:hypothetical protein
MFEWKGLPCRHQDHIVVKESEIFCEFFGVSLAGHDRQKGTLEVGSNPCQEKCAGGGWHNQTTR